MGELLDGRLLSTNSNRNALTSIITHTHSPDTNLELDDLVRRDLLLALVRADGKLRPNALALIDLALRSTEDTSSVREEVRRGHILLEDLVDGFHGCGFDEEVEVASVLPFLSRLRRMMKTVKSSREMSLQETWMIALRRPSRLVGSSKVWVNSNKLRCFAESYENLWRVDGAGSTSFLSWLGYNSLQSVIGTGSSSMTTVSIALRSPNCSSDRFSLGVCSLSFCLPFKKRSKYFCNLWFESGWPYSSYHS